MDDIDARTATLRLRGRLGPVPALVFWPAPRDRVRRPVVAMVASQREARTLCRSTGRVVVAITADDGLQAWDAVCWIAAHAPELGARAGAVLLAGAPAARSMLDQVRSRATHDGWPAIDVLQIGPAEVSKSGPSERRTDDEPVILAKEIPR